MARGRRPASPPTCRASARRPPGSRRGHEWASIAHNWVIARLRSFGQCEPASRQKVLCREDLKVWLMLVLMTLATPLRHVRRPFDWVSSAHTVDRTVRHRKRRVMAQHKILLWDHNPNPNPKPTPERVRRPRQPSRRLPSPASSRHRRPAAAPSL